MGKENYEIQDLLEIMQQLRAECPWDRQQTHSSIRKNLIEEAYEVAEAIDVDDQTLLLEELGDLLLQVVFHAQIEKERETFSFGDVVDGICKKLIRRHPHIFGEVSAGTAAQVLENWDEIKKTEKGLDTLAASLGSVPGTLPGLMRTQKVQERAAKAGFGFAKAETALAELNNEVLELEDAIRSGDRDEIEDEIGDVIFSAVGVAHMTGVYAEEAITRSTNKFLKRFGTFEAIAAERGIDIQNSESKTLTRLWREAKKAGN